MTIIGLITNDMASRFIKYITFTIFLILTSCRSKSEELTYKLEDGSTVLVINSPNFQFYFTNKGDSIEIQKDSVTGLYLSGNSIVSTKLITSNHHSSNEMAFQVKTAQGQEANVLVSLNDGVSKFEVIPNTSSSMTTELRLPGMTVAHGLGDAGSYGESFNLVENKNTSYKIVNDGGSNRWTSSFVIFPKNGFAGVCFDNGSKTITTSKTEYTMKVQKNGEATFYYFLGTPKEIYKNYKSVRNQEGFQDIKPKSRLFELGWESWDALGWNTNQHTIKNILQKFLNNKYPIKWAVTGSGFWETGGTTTSFGKWGKKFSEARTFKKWMHSKDIHWMIGLRTNFIPDGGPFYPKTDKRDGNLKVTAFNGNPLSNEALDKNYLVNDKNGSPLKITSSIFPIVPSYILNGNIKEASKWYQQLFEKWDVDGIKEDTMMDLDSLTGIFNGPITEIAANELHVMARNGEFIAPGTLLRINDTRVEQISKRIPINYLQYAASGFPNVYSDVAGTHNMDNLKDADRNIRHAWLLALTAGMAVGAYPMDWTENKRQIFKKTIDFHYALAPYMYSAAIKGYENGFPYTMTPLSIAFPEDPNVSDLDNFQWMIGESIMAAPLLKKHTLGKMNVYLPAGTWYDFESGKRYEGPITLTDFEIPLDKIPCFIGGKGILILRENEKLLGRIYPVTQQTETVFFDKTGQIKSKIRVDNPDWDNIKIIDTSTGESIPNSLVGHAYQFSFETGHSYIVK